jgi:hypothetical protein
MKVLRSVLILLLLPLSLGAKGGDAIRSSAPMTALILDLQAGHLEPLEKAYFEDEIDFFLDYQGAEQSAARELFALREAGRALDSGDVTGARAFLGEVKKYSDQKIFLTAVAEAVEGRFEPAFRNFKSLIDRRGSISRSLLSQAFLGAARVAHEAGDYPKAIFYYTEVRPLDRNFFQAVFEKGWSFYMDGDMNGSLGASLSFMSPYAQNQLFPEAYIYRAGAFYHLCLFDRASETVEQMKKQFIPLQAQVRELKARTSTNWIFDDRILKSVDPRLLGFLVSDARFRSLQRAHLALQAEQKLGGDGGVRQAEAIQFVRAKLAQEVQRVLSKAEQVLAKALEQADSIQIEILQLGVNLLVGAPIEMRDDVRILKLGDVDFDPQVQFWPFKGEFWLDELGSYYYGLKSVCALQGRQ